MKTLVVTFIAIISFASCNDSTTEQTTPPPIKNAIIMDENYNEALAKEVGADDFGMKKYVMAFLKRGSNTEITPEEAGKLQKAHLENIGRMAEEGKLLLAGPFMDNGDIRGIYIFNVESLEEAKALTETDPAIQAKTLEMELRPWYGSAALVKLNGIHALLQKQNVADQF